MNPVIIALAAILAAWPVLGGTFPERETTYKESSVLNLLRSKYFTIDKDSTRCDGVYGFVQLQDRRVVICLDYHDNLAELEDTIRHEAIHAVQVCKGSNLTKASNSESEARTLAKELAERDIITLINRYC